MSEQEMLDQLHDLIHDRSSFISGDKENSSVFQKDIDALKKIIKDYTILRDAAYRSMEEKGENLCIWINENVNLRKVEILNIWKSDYDDIRCNAILYKDKKQVANIIASYDYETIRNFTNQIYPNTKFEKQFMNVPLKTLIYDDFDKYLKLPKISKCSKLLQEVYDTVCESDATMCHITEDDWKECYADRFSNKDIEKLKEEVKKYCLEAVITFNDGEYKIVGYGDLETRLNDNRKFVKEKDIESR